MLFRKLFRAMRHIPNPEELPVGYKVEVFEKGSRDWWQHGWICIMKDGTKKVNCMDGYYDLNEVEVYKDN